MTASNKGSLSDRMVGGIKSILWVVASKHHLRSMQQYLSVCVFKNVPMLRSFGTQNETGVCVFSDGRDSTVDNRSDSDNGY